MGAMTGGMNAPGALTHASEQVRNVEARLADPTERSLRNRLMKRYHYLGFQALVGQSLRYVAVHHGQWLALFMRHFLTSPPLTEPATSLKPLFPIAYTPLRSPPQARGTLTGSCARPRVLSHMGRLGA